MSVEATGVLTVRNALCGRDSLLIGQRVSWQHGVPGVGPLGHVLFVHGYNNTHDQAQVSYARFRGCLGKYRANARVLEFHWPGDAVYTLPGAAVYPAQIIRAIDCAQLLARWIEEQNTLASFILVGHSLGCRLILEALKSLNPARRYQIKGVCLMAAAVPVRMIRKQELGPAHASPSTRWRILYSHGDKVLGRIFHFGQIFDSIFTRAVGYCGEPEDQWQGTGREREEMHDGAQEAAKSYYGHGWYWPGGQHEGSTTREAGGRQPLPPIDPPGGNKCRSAKAVARMLGVVMDREMDWREPHHSRAVASDRKFLERNVGSKLRSMEP